MRFLGLLILVVGSLVSGYQSTGVAQTLATGFVQEQLASGLNPSAMTIAPDGRLFVVEKGGKILVYRDGRLLEDPFLALDVDDFNERGLSGITFHPDFENNGYFYVYYTVQRQGRNRISRFRANGDFAVPGSEEILFELDELIGSVHNGGAMVWLPDTTLVIAIGDGGTGNTAQSTSTLLGKVLRINDDGTIPEDNPFYTTLVGDARAIYSSGLRNPFTMAASPSTGQVLANDVGNASWEEVNEIRPGANYGWPIVEGRLGLDQAPPDHQEALYEYSHDVGCAVIGATFYEPAVPSFPPEYYGKYFFGDYCRGFIQVLNPETGVVENEIARGLDRVVAFAVDSLGDLYYLARATGDGSTDDNTSTSQGTLWRIRYTGSGAPIVSTNPQDILLPVGDTARFRVSASGQPPYRFQWRRNGEILPADTFSSLVVPTVQLTDDGTTFSAVVSNDFGADTSQVAVLSVTSNTRPRPVITFPQPGSTYRAGETLYFSGEATDAEDGILSASELRWQVDFHHDDHVHPASTFEATSSDSIQVPTTGEVSSNVFYRISLTAVDADGLEQTAQVDLYPELTELTFLSDPPGLFLNADGYAGETPFIFESVVGLERVVLAPGAQQVGSVIYAFKGWDIPAGESSPALFYTAQDAATSFKARYEALPQGQGTGLLGQYFEGRDSTDRRLLHERIDTTINFNWGFSSPVEGVVPQDGFAVVWTGFLEAPLDGEYRITTGANDGVRLWLDGELLIDNWENQETKYRTVAVNLVAGEKVPIRVEYFDWILGSIIGLFWDHDLLPEQVIPKTSLYPPSVIRPDTLDSGSGLQLFASRQAGDGLELGLGIGGQQDDVEATIQLYSLSGSLITELSAMINQEIRTVLLWPSPLPSGAYVVRVRAAGQTKSIRLGNF